MSFFYPCHFSVLGEDIGQMMPQDAFKPQPERSSRTGTDVAALSHLGGISRLSHCIHLPAHPQTPSLSKTLALSLPAGILSLIKQFPHQIHRCYLKR